VSPVHGVSRPLLLVKGTLAGKVASALRRYRRKPAQAFRAARLAAGGHPDRQRGGARAVYLLLCGPGSLDDLADALDSIAAWEDDGVATIVVDDATVDVAQVGRRHPGAEVVRLRWPSGGPPRQSPALNLGLRAALVHYDFEVLCKLDTDALVTGPGLTEAAARRFAQDPGLGMLGSLGMRADGVPEDYTYDAWLVRHERRWSPTVRNRVQRAERAGWDGTKVHGGVYVVSRAALAAAAAAGDLECDTPWWSQIPEDLWLSLAVRAAGFRLGSWGAPGEPLASGSNLLPVPLADVRARGVLAVHSVRRGLGGEPEPVVRAALRAQRPSTAS
jgi:hypothetical protein